MIYLFTVYSLLFIVLAVKQPRWALFLICALLPTYQLRFQVLGLPTTFLETAILILFITYFIRNNQRIFKFFTCLRLACAGRRQANIQICKFGSIRKFVDWKWLILAWLAVGLIGVIVSPDKWGALGHWRAYFLEPILLLLVLLDFAARDTKTRIHTNDTNTASTTFTPFSTSNTILLGLSASALFVSIWAIYQKIIGQGMASLETWQYPLTLITRPTGPFPHSNFLGLFLGPLIVLFLGKFLESLKNKKLLFSIYYFLVSVLSILAIVFARSEGAILGVAAGLIFLSFVYLKKRTRLIFVTILLLFGIFLLFFSPWQRTIWQKITFQDLSLQIRLNIWQGAINLIKAQPVFGAGLRGYQKLITEYQQPFVLPGVEGIISNEFHPYPHNLFLAIWSELGILGLLVFLLIAFQFFKLGFNKIIQTIRTYPNTPNKFFNFNFLIFILAAMVVILVHGCVDTPYFKNDLAVIFWLIIGLLVIHRQKIDEAY